MKLVAWDLALRLATALLLDAAIGLERQWLQKVAGLRTNTLVSLGASGFVVYGALIGAPLDPHVAAQAVTGSAILGDGVILRQGLNLHGLNPAASCGARRWWARWPAAACWRRRWRRRSWC